MLVLLLSGGLALSFLALAFLRSALALTPTLAFAMAFGMGNLVCAVTRNVHQQQLQLWRLCENLGSILIFLSPLGRLCWSRTTPATDCRC